MTKKLLTKKQIKFLSRAFDFVYDEIKHDIITLSNNKDERDQTWLWDQLPPLGRAHLDLPFAFNLLTTLTGLVQKFHTKKKLTLGSRAEEIILHIVIDTIEVITEIEDVKIKNFDDTLLILFTKISIFYSYMTRNMME